MSLVEAVTNVVVGYVLAIATQMTLFPILGLAVSFAENLLIGIVFTIMSIGRSYALRRLFEARRVHESRMDTAARRRAAARGQERDPDQAAMR